MSVYIFSVFVGRRADSPSKESYSLENVLRQGGIRGKSSLVQQIPCRDSCALLNSAACLLQSGNHESYVPILYYSTN
jgi:hypothetical protein